MAAIVEQHSKAAALQARNGSLIEKCGHCPSFGPIGLSSTSGICTEFGRVEHANTPACAPVRDLLRGETLVNGITG